MELFKTQLKFLLSPRTVIAQLDSSRRAPFTGLKHVLLMAVLWELAILLWALGDATPTMPAFLRIPDEHYYYYQLAFMIPMFVVVWLVAGGVAYLLAKALGGAGSFDTILGGFGISGALAGYFALIPDLIQGTLWSTGLVVFSDYQEATSKGLLAAVVVAYVAAYGVAYVLLYAATIRNSQNLGRVKSVLIGFAAFAASAALFITIVR